MGHEDTDLLVSVKCLTHPADHRAEVALLQDVQELLLWVTPTRVQVLPDGAAEKEGVLRNNGQPGPAEGDNSTKHTN